MILNLLLATAIMHAAPSQYADTLRSSAKADSVIITVSGNTTVVNEYSDGSKVYIYRSSDDIDRQWDGWMPRIPFALGNDNRSKSRHHKTDKDPRGGRCGSTAMDGFYVGAAIPLSGPYGITNGWEIGVQHIVGGYWQPRKNGVRFSLGFGMGYRQESFGKGMTLSKQGYSLILIPLANGVSDATARIKSMVCSFPLTIKQKIGHSASIQLSGVLQLNTYSKAVTSYRLPDGTNNKMTYKGLSQQPATIDIVGAVGFTGFLGAYVRYSPMSPWHEEYGPVHRTVCIGGMLFF